MSVRYFRAEEAIYEQVRATLDSAWGHPTQDGLTQTCIAPAAIAPRGNADGLVYLAVYDSFCDYAEVASMLPELLASGAVEELTAAEYAAVFPPPTMPT